MDVDDNVDDEVNYDLKKCFAQIEWQLVNVRWALARHC